MAIFDISAADGNADSHIVYSMAVACWKVDLLSEAWEQAVSTRNGLAAQFNGLLPVAVPPAAPPAVPWLAVMLTPVYADIPLERARMLHHLEQCLFWALAEGS